MLVQLQRRRTGDSEPRVAAEHGELALQPARQRDVVGVEAGHIPARGEIERPVERGGEADALVVAHDDDTRVGDLLQQLRSPVRRAVVDDDELQVPHSLPKHARHSCGQKALRVVRGEQDGHEGHGALAYFAVGGLPLPTWDLVVCTVGRTEELSRLLDSLERQTHRAFRVLLVDQNDDDRVGSVVSGHPALDIVRLSSPRGLSHARNTALPNLSAELVAFPDDDCGYPPDLLEQVARRFAEEPALDGLTGRDADQAGRGSRLWPSEPGTVTVENVWYHGLSAAVALRRGLVERVGPFDERLGLGAETPWSSGEEVDYLIRALRLGARVEYEPDFAVEHELGRREAADLRSLGRRDGGSVGYLLRKHGYPARTVARMLLRPVGGTALSLLRLDPSRARFHLATLRGRLAGYAAGRPA
jgi:GT2 family glycosyltransferase